MVRSPRVPRAAHRHLIRQGRTSWLPIKKAIVIEGRNKEKKDVPGLYSHLSALKAQTSRQAAEVRALREEQEEHQVELRGLRDEVSELHKLGREIRELVARSQQR